jgi:hypothetical protein
MSSLNSRAGWRYQTSESTDRKARDLPGRRVRSTLCQMTSSRDDTYFSTLQPDVLNLSTATRPEASFPYFREAVIGAHRGSDRYLYMLSSTKWSISVTVTVPARRGTRNGPESELPSLAVHQRHISGQCKGAMALGVTLILFTMLYRGKIWVQHSFRDSTSVYPICNVLL